MKIKITENQLKRVIEKYKEKNELNEAWYDDILDKTGLNVDNLKSKIKDIFKKITGVDYEKKDNVKVDKIPTKKEIEKNIKDIKTDVEQKSKDGTTIVIGGISYATGNWMKSQWEKAGLSTDDVEFINYNDVSKLEKLKDTKNVTKIMGFSAGGRLVWKEIDNNPRDYTFIGLIDPSSSKVYNDLPSNVYSLSNSNNWGGYPSIKNVLSQMEKNGVLTKTSKSHRDIPLEFFKKYKDKLN